MTQSLFEQAGAESGVHAIIDDFVERVFADPMIGFFFAKSSKERIKTKEYEFAAGHLGAPVPYTGRPLPHAHAAHPITGGHFMRRLQILKETLQHHAVPSAVIDHWLEHTERMRPFITKQAGSECNDDASPKAESAQPPGSASADKPSPTLTGNVPTTPTAALEASVASKATPSIEEINAYLERSAAMTKKRLPLAFSTPQVESGTSVPDTASATTTASTPTPAASATPDTTGTALKASRALPLVGKPRS